MSDAQDYRIEHDSLGEVRVPAAEFVGEEGGCGVLEEGAHAEPDVESVVEGGEEARGGHRVAAGDEEVCVGSESGPVQGLDP